MANSNGMGDIWCDYAGLVAKGKHHPKARRKCFLCFSPFQKHLIHSNRISFKMYIVRGSDWWHSLFLIVIHKLKYNAHRYDVRSLRWTHQILLTDNEWKNPLAQFQSIYFNVFAVIVICPLTECQHENCKCSTHRTQLFGRVRAVVMCWSALSGAV